MRYFSDLGLDKDTWSLLEEKFFSIEDLSKELGYLSRSGFYPFLKKEKLPLKEKFAVQQVILNNLLEGKKLLFPNDFEVKFTEWGIYDELSEKYSAILKSFLKDKLINELENQILNLKRKVADLKGEPPIDQEYIVRS